MPEVEQEQDQHELWWMFQDAVGLLNLQRKYSALLLLLCAVDALARRRFPNKGVGERFEEFLKEQMRREGRPQVHNIEIPSRGELLTFERILYKYLRNPVVHEGAQLALDHPKGYAVQIDWEALPRGIKVDSDNNRLILGGELVLDILLDAVSNGLRQDTTSGCT